MKVCPQCQLRCPADTLYCFVDGAELVPMRDPFVGTTIAGRYVVEQQLGEGGTATVYRARYTLVDRPCAVKLMNPSLASDATVRERFRREARSAQALSHPNVIEIFDQGETDGGIPYIVMELLEGQSLSALIDDEPLSAPRAVPIMLQIARATARAHDLGVVHRDLKPDNVFVCKREDGSDLVKILDFGIARFAGDPRLTRAGELFGTPPYMAPERITGGETGPSVDLYALGVVFFEMTTGRTPFEAPDPATLLVRHLRDRPPPPRSLNPRIPEAVDRLVVQLLEKDPRARPVDGHRVARDLTDLARSLGIRVPAEPEADPESFSRPPARARPAVGIAQWRRRIEIFDRMLSRAYGSEEPPRAQEQTLSELRALVDEIEATRRASTEQQHILEDVEAKGREGRQRLGFAVDALGLDASKAKDDTRTARAELDRCRRDVEAAARAYGDAHLELLTWEGRSAEREPHPQLARSHRLCAERVDRWLEARDRASRARSAAESRERALSDLEYQIAELRGAIGSHEQAVDHDRSAAGARLVELSARTDRIERRALELARRFCEPLRARTDLIPLFQSLEASASPR